MLYDDLTKLRNLKHMVDYAAENFGDTDFLVYKENGGLAHRTYNDLKKYSDAFSRMLIAKGLKGSHAALVGGTSFEWIAAYFGTADSGSVVVPLAPGETDEMNCRLVEFADVSVFCFTEKQKPLYEKLKQQGGIKLFISLDNKSCSADVLNISDIFSEYCGVYDEEPQADDMCAIVFTSGTTGFPKGVMLSHRNLVWSATSVHVACPTKRMFCCLPIHHMFCFTANITKSICRGKTVCVNDSLMNLVADLRLYKPDSIIAVPQIVKKLMEGAIKFASTKPEMNQRDAVLAFLGGNITDIISGGAPLEASANERYNATGIYVFNGYGMTECSPIIANNSLGNFRHGSVGLPIPGMDVKIVNGEIMCKGPSVMSGYYKNPEATAAAFDEDGYLHTGDVGHFDDDGYLYVTGRCKNLILLSNGENVSAEMLEGRFATEKAVKEVICFGDEGAICCEVYPDKEYLSANGIDSIESVMPDILNRVNSSLATYQRISAFIVRDTPFEKTSSAKIKRGAHGKITKAPAVLPSDESERRVFDAVKELLGVKEISMTDNFFAIGGDSLSAVELALSLNLKPQTVYDKPFLKSLAGEIKADDNIFADKTADINAVIKETSEDKTKTVYGKSVLLTGATGFLGIHILSELIKAGRNVICLVRNEEKLHSYAGIYFGGLDFSAVTCIKGDIEKKHLGIPADEYKKLCACVDCVFHIAANVHHAGDYSDLERTNVGGTKNVIEFCLDSGAVMQHCSTVSLHGAATCRQSDMYAVFDETKLDIGQFYGDNVYIHSKYCAEQAVITARKKGLKANIYRIGNLTWRTGDGKFQINSADNGFLHRMRAMLKLGLYHDNMDKYPMDLTAVDECASAFVKLALLGYTNEIYHMYNPQYLPAKDLFSAFGITPRHVSALETIETMSANKSDRDINVYLFYMIISGRSENIVMDNAFTLSKMAECGFSWSYPDGSYLKLSGIDVSEFTHLSPMRKTGGVMNPIQKVVLGALKEAKPFDGEVLDGCGTVLKLQEKASALGIAKPLIITIPSQFRTEKLKEAISAFDDCVIFDDIKGEPTVSDSDSALSMFTGNSCDGVIGIGGGSVLDVAKVTSLRASNPARNPDDLFKIYSVADENTPLILVPTTAGTGSEATVFAVLKDSGNKKKAFTSDKFYPDLVILDPELTVSVPAASTAFTGIDALSHVIEGTASLFAPSFPDDTAFAEKAVNLIVSSLAEAYNNPGNIEARSNMQLGAFCAGRCFGRISTGYIHAIAHRLGEIYHLPHGQAIACCIIPVIENSAPYFDNALAKLAVYSRLCDADTDKKTAAALFTCKIKDIIAACNIDIKPSSFNPADADRIVADAQDEAKAVGCPKPFSDAELKDIVISILS